MWWVGRAQNPPDITTTTTTTNLPSRAPCPSQFLHYQRGEDTNSAIKISSPEAIIHLILSTRQHADDGSLRETQLLGALPLIVVQGSRQPSCGQSGSAPQDVITWPCPSMMPNVPIPYPPPGSRTSSAAIMLESCRCRAAPEGPVVPVLAAEPGSLPTQLRHSRYFSGT